eukprot:6310428-Prymnesium_polylepis.2
MRLHAGQANCQAGPMSCQHPPAVCCGNLATRNRATSCTAVRVRRWCACFTVHAHVHVHAPAHAHAHAHACMNGSFNIRTRVR